VKIRLIWIGSNAEAELQASIERYFNRIKHFLPIEVVELPVEKSRQKKSDAAIMHADSEKLLAAIPDRGTTVVLDERGTLLDSLKFSKWIEELTVREPYGIHFVLGGDVGFDDRVRQRADRLLALSPMTLPHQIARLVLIEQIYRACTLMRNITYHK
jgi:23S rRNA (pseudouridine1915-N3)-methyltransferase